MSLPPSRRAAAHALQVLISGRVIDRLTRPTAGTPTDFLVDQPPPGPLTVRLLDRDLVDAGAEDATYPLAGKVTSDGAFAFYDVPERAFPLIGARTYRLRVDASAPRYRADAPFDLTLGPMPDAPPEAAQPALELRPEDVSALPDVPEQAAVRLYTGAGLPREGIELVLAPEPVGLRGRVVRALDPTVGIAGAAVTVLAAGTAVAGTPVTARPDGTFTVPEPLPAERQLIVRAEPGGAMPSVEIAFLPDYTRPVNELVILVPSS